MNLYTVLGLSTPSANAPPLSSRDLKQAYRRALLLHHPDKAKHVATTNPKSPAAELKLRGKDGNNNTTAAPSDGPKPSVDDISHAYRVLSDPRQRAAYDRELLFSSRSPLSGGGGSDADAQKFHTGLDVVDLDDMAFDEAAGTWYRACRCGQERGYVVDEGQLEGGAELGEVIVGCGGCSLWLKVLFGVVEDEDLGPG